MQITRKLIPLQPKIEPGSILVDMHLENAKSATVLGLTGNKMSGTWELPLGKSNLKKS